MIGEITVANDVLKKTLEGMEVWEEEEEEQSDVPFVPFPPHVCCLQVQSVRTPSLRFLVLVVFHALSCFLLVKMGTRSTI